jgi:conserved hypothetical protein
MSKTLKILLLIGLILLFTIISGISSYNGLVTQEESVKQANSKIETALQRRNDLIPNYVAVTKKYMKHEEEIFTKIADARSKIGSSDKNTKNEGEGELSSAISRLLVVQEKYPELKADKQASELTAELAGTENRLFVVRNDYNAIATKYNQSIRTFPRSMFAKMFGFQRAELIEAPKEAKTAPKVDLN